MYCLKVSIEPRCNYLDTLALFVEFSSAPKEPSACNLSSLCSTSRGHVVPHSLQARIQKKLDEELPQERIGGMKLGPKVFGNQGLSKS